jgi:hypothetical protein
MNPLRYHEKLTPHSFWLLPPHVLLGSYPTGEDLTTLKKLPVNLYVSLVQEKAECLPSYEQDVAPAKYINIPIPKKSIIKDEDITDLIHTICKASRGGQNIYIHCDNGRGRTYIVSCCLIKRILQVEPMEYMALCSDSTYDTAKQKEQILRYRSPQCVLFCGDKDTDLCFESQILFELKQLPKYSTIIHCGHKGVDELVGRLALRIGHLSIRGYYMDEKEPKLLIFNGEGFAIGTLPKNSIFYNEPIDLVLAFHPDITYSKGTLTVVREAYERKIPTFVCDLKRKVEYKGSTDVL